MRHVARARIALTLGALAAAGAGSALACATTSTRPAHEPVPTETSAPDASGRRLSMLGGSPDNGTGSPPDRPPPRAPIERIMRGVVILQSPDRAPGRAESAETSSGVLISERGHVVASAHSVRQLQSLDVVAHDGRLLSARVVAVDADTDLALLSVTGDLSRLEPIPWTDAAPEVGQAVHVAGNVLGGGLALSSGVVAALGRTDLGHARYEDYLMTDAPIARGASGGAVVDESSRLVGIAIGALNDGQAGAVFGLAVSHRLARPVVEQLMAKSSVGRGHVGMEYADLDGATARRLGSTVGRGARVTVVEPAGPAARAGLMVDDIVVQAGGWPIARRGNLRAALSVLDAGQGIQLSVLRQGREQRMLFTSGGL